MQRTNRRIWLFIILFGAIFIAYFVLRFAFAPRIGVPQQFYEARARSAVIAQDIVNDSNGIVSDINRVNELDRQNLYKEALKVLEDVAAKNADIRSRSVDLARELQAMTETVPKITSDNARQAAVDSISLRLALENRLLGYTDEVARLLAALKAHFERGKVKPQDITILVNDINAEVRAINNFNSQAGQAMDRFDKIVK